MTTTTIPAPPLPPPSAQTTLLERYLRRLRLPVVLANYPKVAQEAARGGFGYEQFLLLLAEQELAQRDENMQRRRLSQAKFPVLKTLDQYDFSLVPQLNRQLVLELAQGHYIGQRENILLVGAIGTGKTHLATALGVAACRQGHRVRFTTAAGLTNELFEAQAAHRLSRVEQQLLRHQVLILDEVGFVPFTKAGADLLFSFLAALHEQVSVIITTTVPFAEWAALFGGDQRLTAALLDRLTFHAHIVQFTGDSYRLRQSLKRQEEDRRPR
ncbi:MAG TPA: IS21-like element helper ATPase IstB [Thermomicrobiales bacterium]|nr:IS21-like element helper ATPase IstB [Thermomicrobiales bacterium]